MNERGKCWLIAGVSLLLGAAAGGTGMYFYSKRYFQAKLDEELQSMGEFYINKYEKVKEKDDGQTNKEESNEEQQTEEDIEKRTSVFEGQKLANGDELDKTSYAACFNDSNSDKLPSPKKTRTQKKKKKVDIEIVDQSVWDENPASLDSKFLVYYDVDGVLIDEETEKIFEDGMDDAALIKLVDIHSDEADDGVLILQSNFTKTLYHVTVEQASFEEIGSDD